MPVAYAQRGWFKPPPLGRNMIPKCVGCHNRGDQMRVMAERIRKLEADAAAARLVAEQATSELEDMLATQAEARVAEQQRDKRQRTEQDKGAAAGPSGTGAEGDEMPTPAKGAGQRAAAGAAAGQDDNAITQ